MRALMTATVASMIGQFNMDNIKLLMDLGYEVDVACNFKDISVWNKEKIEKFKTKLRKMNINYFQIDFERNALNIERHIRSYFQIKKLMNIRKYKLIHTHTPISSLLIRFAYKNSNIYNSCCMIYTAHGFHFFKGGPIASWIIFYPIEKYLSRLTDILITINNEDYNLAKNEFYCKRVYKVPGVGIETTKFLNCNVDKIKFRKSLGLNDSDFVVLSVGELCDRKNHEVIIRAISKLKNTNIKYLIAGIGSNKSHLEEVIRELNLENNVFLLGYRTDIDKLCKISDLYAFPSKREGLGLAAIEGMASGLPIITSNINGINDYSINGKTGMSYFPNDINGFSDGILYFFTHPEQVKEIGMSNKEMAKKYDICKVRSIMKKIYGSVGDD